MNIIVIRCRRHNRGENPKSFHLLQIALDQGQKRAMRYLTEKDGNIVKGGLVIYLSSVRIRFILLPLS